jgi:hypothetical protein
LQILQIMYNKYVEQYTMSYAKSLSQNNLRCNEYEQKSEGAFGVGVIQYIQFTSNL